MVRPAVGNGRFPIQRTARISGVGWNGTQAVPYEMGKPCAVEFTGKLQVISKNESDMRIIQEKSQKKEKQHENCSQL